MFGKRRSKGQELREKFRRKAGALNRDAIAFQGKVIRIALEEFRCDANCQQWHDALYQDYQNDGSPADGQAWLRQRLERDVMWVDTPPDWGTDEPEWPFHEGRPMIFVRQFALPENEVTRSAVTWDTMLYVFAVRVPVDGSSYRMAYRVVQRPMGLQTAEDHYREEERRG